MTEFFGKYRGKVENNADPKQMGRLQVSAPVVLGDSRVWAMPSVPYAGPKVGFFAIPPVGANIWVEFEGGDLNYPIWSGCFWGEQEVPVVPALAGKKVFKTASITLTLSDDPNDGGLTLEIGAPAVPTPLKLAFNKQGIEINGNPAIIKLTNAGIEISNNPASVKISSAGVELNAPPATFKLSSSSIELNNSSASVKLSPATVSINNGALEVM